VAAFAILSTIAVEVIKEAEERSERGFSGVIESAREESHCIYWVLLSLEKVIELMNCLIVEIKVDNLESC
jgi:hypothetical protein